MTFYILCHQTVQYPAVNDNADLEFLSTPHCRVRNSSYEFAVISKNKILRDFWETQSLKNGLNRRFWKKDCEPLTPSFKVRILIPLPEKAVLLGLLFIIISKDSSLKWLIIIESFSRASSACERRGSDCPRQSGSHTSARKGAVALRRSQIREKTTGWPEKRLPGCCFRSII